MERYKVKVESEALTDIQEITDWYNAVQVGLGRRFQKTAINQINSLKKDPQIFAIRYKEIRCALVNKFPYMIHFHINVEDRTVEILAVISTNRNPKIWDEKISR
jgi:ABC-type uncharacterized transport system ATPase subunit